MKLGQYPGTNENKSKTQQPRLAVNSSKNLTIGGGLEGFPADLNRWDSQGVRDERFFWH